MRDHSACLQCYKTVVSSPLSPPAAYYIKQELPSLRLSLSKTKNNNYCVSITLPVNNIFPVWENDYVSLGERLSLDIYRRPVRGEPNWTSLAAPRPHYTRDDVTPSTAQLSPLKTGSFKLLDAQV